MKMKELLADPKKWTKGSYARNEFGDPCKILSTEATCFCLYGALTRCYPAGEQHVSAANKLEDAMRKLNGHTMIVKFNDSPDTTHEMLMQVLEEADV